MAGKPYEMGPVGHRVAANLRRIRREREFTTAVLSQRLAAVGHPIADSGITKIEKGRRRVDVDDLVALAQVLEVAPGMLLSGDFALVPVKPEGPGDGQGAWS